VRRDAEDRSRRCRRYTLGEPLLSVLRDQSRSDRNRGDGRLANGKKQALNLRGQFDVVKEFVTLPLDRFRERLALFDIALDDVNNKCEAEGGGKIVEDAQPWVQTARRVVVVKQDANCDKAVTNFFAQENRTEGKGEKIQVDERNRDNEMVCICDRGKRAQDQNERQPGRSV
jgi:hypothetical protein